MDKWHHQQENVIFSTDADASYECRLSALFSIAQRAVTRHSKLLQIDRDSVLKKYNGSWMALRIRISLKRSPVWGEGVKTIASIRRPVGKRLYWDNDFYIGGEHIGEGNSTWVLVNQDTKKSMDLSSVAELPREDPENAKTLVLSRITFPTNMELHDTRQLYYSDTDINGHMNNARYVDLACDAAELHLRPKGVFLREIIISYVGECYAGERLSLYRGKENGYLYIHGVGPDGSDRFDCRIKMSSDMGL